MKLLNTEGLCPCGLHRVPTLATPRSPCPASWQPSTAQRWARGKQSRPDAGPVQTHEPGCQPCFCHFPALRALGKSLCVTEPQFPCMENGDEKTSWITVRVKQDDPCEACDLCPGQGMLAGVLVINQQFVLSQLPSPKEILASWNLSLKGLWGSVVM